MNWTLLVPGVLLPPALAPELARHLQLPGLVQLLAQARAGTAALAADTAAASAVESVINESSGAPPTQAPHWTWLARQFGLDPAGLATAPYAWRVLGAEAQSSTGDAAAQTEADPESNATSAVPWIAHADPVHMAIARDHFIVTDLIDAPLRADESAELLALANATLAAESRATHEQGPAPGSLRLEIHQGHWFLFADRPLQMTTWSLDSVLGQSVQDRLPLGPDARRWRILSNEIQMSWHASGVAAAREAAGLRGANALWLHGGGPWQALAAAAPRQLHAAGAPAEAACVRGWLQAARTPPKAAPAGADVLVIWRELLPAHAHQAWESWLERMPALQAQIETQMQAARQAGARRFDLVVCGAREVRSLAVPLAPTWWDRLRAGGRPPASLLARWLAERAPPEIGSPSTPRPRALAA